MGKQAIVKCPRCGKEYEERRKALSRRDNHTYICSACGVEEALIDAKYIPEGDAAYNRDLMFREKLKGSMCQCCFKRPATQQYDVWSLCDACYKEAYDNDWALQPLDAPPHLINPKPDYCTQNNGDCETCSLSNYGRDCQNKQFRKGGSI